MGNKEKLKLLYEYHDAEFIIDESVNTNKEKVKKYKISGIFSTIGEKNRNGRIYSRELWEREVKKYQDVIKSGAINRLCEWEHPERGDVDPMEAVAAITKLEVVGNYVMGEAVLLDNPKANQLKSLIDNGIKISVSSRGSGTVKNGIVENFNLITYDLVSRPSDYNATMEGSAIYESVKDFEIIGGKLVESKTDSKKASIKDYDNQKIDESIKKSFIEFINILKNKNI